MDLEKVGSKTSQKKIAFSIFSSHFWIEHGGGFVQRQTSRKKLIFIKRSDKSAQNSDVYQVQYIINPEKHQTSMLCPLKKYMFFLSATLWNFVTKKIYFQGRLFRNGSFWIPFYWYLSSSTWSQVLFLHIGSRLIHWYVQVRYVQVIYVPSAALAQADKVLLINNWSSTSPQLTTQRVPALSSRFFFSSFRD